MRDHSISKTTLPARRCGEVAGTWNGQLGLRTLGPGIWAPDRVLGRQRCTHLFVKFGIEFRTTLAQNSMQPKQTRKPSGRAAMNSSKSGAGRRLSSWQCVTKTPS
jgi:hypothetical protein